MFNGKKKLHKNHAILHKTFSKDALAFKEDNKSKFIASDKMLTRHSLKNTR